MHINRSDLMIFIGIIIVDSFLCVPAGGIDRDLIFSVCHLTASALLVHRSQNVEKLADAFRSESPDTACALVNATFAKREVEERSPGSPSAPIPRL